MTLGPTRTPGRCWNGIWVWSLRDRGSVDHQREMRLLAWTTGEQAFGQVAIIQGLLIHIRVSRRQEQASIQGGARRDRQYMGQHPATPHASSHADLCHPASILVNIGLHRSSSRILGLDRRHVIHHDNSVHAREGEGGLVHHGCAFGVAPHTATVSVLSPGPRRPAGCCLRDGAVGGTGPYGGCVYSDGSHGWPLGGESRGWPETVAHAPSTRPPRPLTSWNTVTNVETGPRISETT